MFNLKFNKPELVIEIDRDKARASGVTVRDIADALQLYFSGQRYGFFIRMVSNTTLSVKPIGLTATTPMT